MRRGLGTTDEDEADRLVQEMNVLLADRAWWNANRRGDAAKQFSRIIVDAFYDEIQAGRENSESLREASIPLPVTSRAFPGFCSSEQRGPARPRCSGSSSTLILTGTGFPQRLRQKTTIADIEVVQAEGDYRAAVTFFTEFQAQSSIEECIIDSCLATLDRQPTDKVAERFLNHRDQKFRLSYVLGGWNQAPPSGKSDEDEFSFDAETDTTGGGQDDDAVTVSEQSANREALRGFIERIDGLVESAEQRLSDELGIDPDDTSGDDREVAKQLMEENFEEYVAGEELFQELVQDVLDCVRTRFDLITEGTLERYRSGWPKRWTFEAAERGQFIAQIRWFSSNDWRQFGRLLTPLVDGIRVRGPLFPSFVEAGPQLVLIDGQGLGHTPDSSSSVTTHITRRFDQVNVILLVDNAQQPMQAAPLSVLRTVAHSGQQREACSRVYALRPDKGTQPADVVRQARSCDGIGSERIVESAR